MKRLLFLILAVLASACAVGPTPPTFPESATVRPTLAENTQIAHARVDYWVERFTTGDRRPEIERAFARKPQHEAMITRKLRERGMPEDLLYLAMAESGFNPAAHSVAGATGIWQMIADTAVRYGLDTTAGSDERHDPEKSTDAALAHLAFLYKKFGSWHLAAAAYNAGEGRVARIMTEVTGSERGTDEDYFRIWDRLPAETRDYVPAMLALKQIASEPVRYGFGAN